MMTQFVTPNATSQTVAPSELTADVTKVPSSNLATLHYS